MYVCLTEIEIGIHLNRSYTPDYDDESSEAYAALASLYVSEVRLVQD